MKRLRGSILPCPGRRRKRGEAVLRCSANVQAVLRQAARLTAALGEREVPSVCLLGALAKEAGTASRILQEAGIDQAKCEAYLHIAARLISPLYISRCSPQTKRLLDLAAAFAKHQGDEMVHTRHLLLAILKEPRARAYRMLRDLGADTMKMQQMLLSGDTRQAVPAPELECFSIDLTKAARSGQYDPVAAREEEIDMVFHILCGSENNSPVLVGDPGVGKTAIAEEIARRIAEEKCSFQRLVRLDTGALIAGTGMPGDFEKRLTDLLREIRCHQELLLFIDDMDTLAGLGAPEGALDALSILRRAIKEDGLRILGATTPELFEQHFAKDSGFASFMTVHVAEPEPEEAVEILRALRAKYEAHHGVKISDEALEAAVRLSVRIAGRRLPDKAIDLMDEAAAKVRISALAASAQREDTEKLEKLIADKEDAVTAEAYEVAAVLYEEEQKIRARLAQTCAYVKEDGRPLVTVRDIREIAGSWMPDFMPEREEGM